MSEHDNTKKRIDEEQGTAASLAARSYAGIGAIRHIEHAPVRRNTEGSVVRWWFGEYVLGPLFLMLSLVYTFLVPRRISSAIGLRETYRDITKRVVDVFGSIIGLALASPFFLLIPIIIKLDSRGPVFYTQVRVGQNRRRGPRRAYTQAVDAEERRRRERRRENLCGRPFRVLKFRTMIQDAERESGPVWATKNDPRITRIGRFLRKSRLDELPQLVCVLRGEMSLVGPRPERPAFVHTLVEQVPNYHRRLDVKPGITGLAQVENGYDSSLHTVNEKIRTDLRYIDNWSLMSDIKILFRTIWVVTSGRGAN